MAAAKKFGGGAVKPGAFALEPSFYAPLSARYVLMAPAPPRPLTRWLRLPHTARQRGLPNAAPPVVVEPGQECVLQLQLLSLRLILFSPLP